MTKRPKGLEFKPTILTPKQENIYQWGFQPDARHRVACCGRRFGKTFLAKREIKRAVELAAKWEIDTDNEIWFGSPTFKQAKKNFWRRLKQAIPRHWLASKPNESECFLTIKTGHIVRIVGLNDFENLKGSGLFFFIGDEWASVKPEVWTEIIRPMLSTCQGHSLRIGTPKGFNHFYDDFNKGQPGGEPGYKSWQYTTIQGENVPMQEIEDARRDLDQREFDQEYNAQFMNYTGRVIFAFDRIVHVKPCIYDPMQDVHAGMDFNVNPMSATIWQETKSNTGDVVSNCIDEIIIPTSDTVEMSNELVKRYGRGFHCDNSHIRIYPDPAGAQNRTSAQGKTDISILREAKYGFKVIAMASHPLVRDRNNTTNSRFRNAAGDVRAYVDPKCKKTIEAFERLAYKEGTNEPDKSTGYDHPVDASGYYMFTRFNVNAAKFITTAHMAR